MMSLIDQVGESWYEVLKEEFKKDYIAKLSHILRKERAEFTIHPTAENVFRAFRLSPFEKTNVVIVGQDPYPHYHANGLCFSTTENMDDIPPSLKNIFIELEQDIGFQPYHNPDLERWAKQGILLLNTVLTVRHKRPNSHQSIGWERFTSTVINKLIEREDRIVFLLWGRKALNFAGKIPSRHRAIVSPHPSPLSAYRGFFGSKPFSRTNQYLSEVNKSTINWLS